MARHVNFRTVCGRLHEKIFGRIIMSRFIHLAAMKKTLYQILGVNPKASAEEIAAAYDERVQELIFATIQDPNTIPTRSQQC